MARSHMIKDFLTPDVVCGLCENLTFYRVPVLFFIYWFQEQQIQALVKGGIGTENKLDLQCPVLYLLYNLSPFSNPFSDPHLLFSFY